MRLIDLLLAIAFAHATGAVEPYLIIDHGRITVNGELPAQAIRLDGADLGNWTDDAECLATITQVSKDELDIDAWINRGPESSELLIRQFPDGISIHLDVYGHPQPDRWWYGDYDALATTRDPISRTVSELFRACGLPRILPTRELLAGASTPCSPECLRLVAELNDPDWRRRDRATRELLKGEYAAQLAGLVGEMPLAAEQIERIDYLTRLRTP